MCEMRYIPALTGEPLEAVGFSGLTFPRRMQFLWSVCVRTFSPRERRVERKTVRAFPFDAVREWFKKYQESCKTTSFFRLGWKWDPKTDTDLACVPDWREVVRRHTR